MASKLKLNAKRGLEGTPNQLLLVNAQKAFTELGLNDLKVDTEKPQDTEVKKWLQVVQLTYPSYRASNITSLIKHAVILAYLIEAGAYTQLPQAMREKLQQDLELRDLSIELLIGFHADRLGPMPIQAWVGQVGIERLKQTFAKLYPKTEKEEHKQAYIELTKMAITQGIAKHKTQQQANVAKG